MKKFYLLDDGDDLTPPWIARKRIIFLLVSLVVVAALALGGYPYFRDYRKIRLTGKAQLLYEQKDLRSALLLAEQLVAEDRKNFEASRLLAKIFDQVSPLQALDLWERLCQLEPGESANLIGYAYAALRLGEHEKHAGILAQLAARGLTSLEYQTLLAASALQRGDRAGLEKSLRELAEREPGNELAQLNYATLQIESAVPTEVAAARLNLQAIARGARFRIRATLALIKDAPVRWPIVSIGQPPYTRLAEALRLTQPKLDRVGPAAQPFDWDLPTLIAHMQAEPGPNPEDWATLAMWMNLIGQPREALLWLESLPGNPPQILAAQATLATRLAAWSKLEQLLTQQAWGEITPESVRLAFQALAAHEAGDKPTADRAWAMALRNAEYSLPSLLIFYRLTHEWAWQARREQVLWSIVRYFPSYEAAWPRLLQLAFFNRDTAQVSRIYAAWSKAAPEDVSVQSERIILGLLTQSDYRKLIAEASGLFKKAPDHPGCRLMQAVALWRDEQAAQALDMLTSLKQDPAQEPRLALVKGLVLAANLQTAESERWFQIIPLAKLLPEEVALMEAARNPRR